MPSRLYPGSSILAGPVYSSGVLVVAAAISIGGCTVTRAPVPEMIEPEASFSTTGTAPMQDRWWLSLGDEGLSTAVDSALANNLDLATAWERLRAASAVADGESAALWPSIEATAAGEISRSDFDDADTEVRSLQLGLAAGYEIDLWGRIRSSVQAERLRVAATRADYQTATLSLSAEVARTWVQLAEARQQVELVEEQLETNRTVLRLIENRFGLGQVRAVDILRQRQLIEATREQRSIAASRREVLAHQLAVLLGRTPQQGAGLQPARLPELEPLPETGVPLDLIRRRPDLQSAFLALQAADRDVASAVSNQFPRVTLTASATSISDGVQNLFQDWATSIAGDLLAPLFYGGELRAEVERTSAVRQQRLFEYAQAVLTAFREVEDAIVLELRQRERIDRIEAQLDLAEMAYDQLRIQYFNGTNNYLDVLTALDEVQALRRDLLSARLDLVDFRISLYRALAGAIQSDREA